MLKSEEDRIKDLKKMSDKDLIKRAKTFAKKILRRRR